MTRFFGTIPLCAVTLAAAIPAASAQSVLERPPNLTGGWVGPGGTLHFNVLHRFDVSDPPLRKVTNSPTFLIAYGLPFHALVGANYATSSDVVASVPNEWEFFARYAPRTGVLPLDVAIQAGFNEAAESVDGELTLGRSFGPVRALGIARGLSDGYGAGEERWALGGGATIQLHRYVAIAGDVASLLDREPGEEVAWGAALQIQIPYTPHTLSLQATNTSTGTLQGVSRGIDNVRFGFEFTIPVTLGRYFGRRAPEEGAAPAEPAAAAAAGRVTSTISGFAFGPSRIEVSAGTTIEWRNADPVAHTVTASDGSFDSGLIDPGATWRRTFDRPGTYGFHCTPHPFMTGVVIVREAAP